jgi:cobalt-zinc-cadmium efflux system outer membrane protein
VNQTTRFLPTGVNVGIDTEREWEGERVTGPTVELGLPVFDQGQAANAKLHAQLRQSERRVEALTADIRSNVREAHALMSSNHELARLYGDVLLPQRRRIVEVTLQHYNFMLKGTYDLLLAKCNELETESSYIEACRDYWIARAELERAIGGKLPESPTAEHAHP